MKSRHAKAKEYQVWIKYDEIQVSGWYCLCKTGARTIGCCAHIASVIWYLSFYRFNTVKPQVDYGHFIQNAADVTPDIETNGEE